MANFTPISAAIGGALIGLAAVLLMRLNGRIAAASRAHALALGRAETCAYHRRKCRHSSGTDIFTQRKKSTATSVVISAML